MLQNKSISTLLRLLQRLFLLMTTNQKIVSLILLMSQQDQQTIKQFMTNGSLYEWLAQEDEQFESSGKKMKKQIQTNMIELTKLRQSVQSFKNILNSTEIKLKQKQKRQQQLQKQVNKLKRSLQSYEEIDQLLKQKDEEIQKLSKNLNALQMQNSRKQHVNNLLHKQVQNVKAHNQQIQEDYENIKQELEEIKQKWTISKKVTENLQLMAQKSSDLNSQKIQSKTQIGFFQQNQRSQMSFQMQQAPSQLRNLVGYQTDRSQRSYHNSFRQETISDSCSVQEIQQKVRSKDKNQDQKTIKNQSINGLCVYCKARNTQFLRQEKTWNDKIKILKKQRDNQIKLKNLQIQVLTAALVDSFYSNCQRKY